MSKVREKEQSYKKFKLTGKLIWGFRSFIKIINNVAKLVRRWLFDLVD